jgi:hypothetical protein
VSELQTAVDLHAPVLSPKPFAPLPDRMKEVLDVLGRAIEDRERTVMQQERLSESDEDRAYAVDRHAVEFRQLLIGFLLDVTEALTAYRRGNPVRPDDLPAMPQLPAATASVPARRAR